MFKEWDNHTYASFLYYWNNPKIHENVLNEAQQEYFFNADFKDISSCYIISKKMVKERRLNQKIIKELKKLYDERCQLCGERIEDKYGYTVIEEHHIEYYSKTQNNDSYNIMLLCPNHQGIIHKLNPIFDRDGLQFIFPNGFVEKLKLDKHLNT